MIPTIYYHVFMGNNELPTYSNLRVPTLLSIATLRATNPDIDIVVLDGSKKSDWGHFQDKLNFEVNHIEFYLKEKWSHIKGHEHLSRLFDLKRQSKGLSIYCDSDVFWIKDPLPLCCNTNKFCFDGYNTGYFYYDLSSMDCFFEIFESYTISAMSNIDIRKILKTYVSYDGWYDVWDEMILTFMFNKHNDLFNKLPNNEHSTSAKLSKDTKMFHSNGTMMCNYFSKREEERLHSRGLLCLVIKEFYKNICKVLDENDLRMIFSDQELKFYKNQQFSIFDENKLKNTKDEDGHYYIKRAINHPVNLII